MLLSYIPNYNILLDEAKAQLHSLNNAALNSQSPPSVKVQHICVEKYEVQNSTFYTPLSSIYPQFGYEHSQNLIIAPHMYFWIPRFIEILMLLQSIKLFGY